MPTVISYRDSPILYIQHEKTEILYLGSFCCHSINLLTITESRGRLFDIGLYKSARHWTTCSQAIVLIQSDSASDVIVGSVSSPQGHNIAIT